MYSDKSLSNIMVIFGANGDLTYRKLMPALYNLECENMLPPNFAVVAVGRRDKINEEYRKEVLESITSFSRVPPDTGKWALISKRIYYHKADFSDDEGYSSLRLLLADLDKKYGTLGNRVYYLAVAPEYFGLIVEKLHQHNMAANSGSWQRVVIEKPFGKDLKSATLLNEKITSVFSEQNTYRIDHYLGKEMLQNIMVIRFANILFEPLWNSKYIDNVQISSSETLGVENRGNYYEKSGILRDMVQNHMLQLLALTAMEPPSSLDTEAVRSEKVKVLSNLQGFTPDLIKENVVLGQYGPGIVNGKNMVSYRQEEKVNPQSHTPTFAAIKTSIKSPRWENVPFYIRTAKRMMSKSTDVIIQFKAPLHELYSSKYGSLDANLLVIRIQPREGIYLQFNAKRPGAETRIIPVNMDFCQNCQIGSNSPEAYERLLYDIVKGDSTLFTRWDEVEHSWRFVDSIVNYCEENCRDFPNYASGSWGPSASDELLEKGGRKWWNL